MGNVLEIITKESVNINVLPEEVQQAIYSTTDPEQIGDKTCDLYTCVKRKKINLKLCKKLKVSQLKRLMVLIQ